MRVIAAVGHEIDSTLVDFAADARASTPTGAAELATVDIREIENEFAYAAMNMEQALFKNLKAKNEDISSLEEELHESMKERIVNLKEDIDNFQKRLELINPMNVLKRGYSITTNEKGEVIRSIKDVSQNDKIITKVADGEIISVTSEIKGE